MRIAASVEAAPCAGLLQAGLVDEQRRPPSGPILSSLSIARSAADGSVAPGAAEEPLDQLAVVDLDRPPAGIGSARSASADDQRHLDVVVERQRVAADDVDVGLGELAVAALLRPLAAPGLLDLVAPERELEVAGVLQHVARERHRQVEVQPEAGVAPRSSAACSRRRT